MNTKHVKDDFWDFWNLRSKVMKIQTWCLCACFHTNTWSIGPVCIFPLSVVSVLDHEVVISSWLEASQRIETLRGVHHLWVLPLTTGCNTHTHTHTHTGMSYVSSCCLSLSNASLTLFLSSHISSFVLSNIFWFFRFGSVWKPVPSLHFLKPFSSHSYTLNKNISATLLFLLPFFMSWTQRSKTFSMYTKGPFLSKIVHKSV